MNDSAMEYIRSLGLTYFDWVEHRMNDDTEPKCYSQYALIVSGTEGDYRVDVGAFGGEGNTWMIADDLGWNGPVNNVQYWCEI